MTDSDVRERRPQPTIGGVLSGVLVAAPVVGAWVGLGRAY